MIHYIIRPQMQIWPQLRRGRDGFWAWIPSFECWMRPFQKHETHIKIIQFFDTLCRRHWRRANVEIEFTINQFLKATMNPMNKLWFHWFDTFFLAHFPSYHSTILLFSLHQTQFLKQNIVIETFCSPFYLYSSQGRASTFSLLIMLLLVSLSGQEFLW